jgi:hypothetical protein
VHIFTCGSPFGIRPCDELAKSVKGQLHTETNPLKQSGPIAVWGQIRGARELLNGCGDHYRLDHAYIGRNEFFRMTRDDFQPSVIRERPSDRWDDLKKRFNLSIEPWRNGKKIVVALSMPGTYDFFGVPQWGKSIEGELKKSNREVVVRQRKETRPIKNDLADAHCLITYSSNSVIDALLMGVPVFTAGPSIARPMSGKWGDWENPVYPDRESFMNHVAYCQFSLAEFRSGYAITKAE